MSLRSLFKHGDEARLRVSRLKDMNFFSLVWFFWDVGIEWAPDSIFNPHQESGRARVVR